MRVKGNKRPTGYVIYRGPSLLDGAPIAAVVLVGRSSNVKTGAMLQTYILRTDRSPLDAVRTGADVSICGICKLRGTAVAPFVGMPSDRVCYVNLGQGPRAVYAGLQRAIYPDAADYLSDHRIALRDAVRGRLVRLGTYGDPAAVPAQIWERLLTGSAGRTGYTHQWRNPALSTEQRDRIGRLCMASADSADDATAARACGYRPFRVRTAAEPIGTREFICPASAEAGKRETCATCTACDGAERGAGKASPVIIAHGSLARRFIAIRAAA